MLVRFEDIREEPFQWQESVDISPDSLEQPNLQSLGPVSWRGRVTFAEPGFHLSARLRYEQQLECIRCLRPAVQEVNAEVELMIFAHEDRRGAGDYELQERDMSIVHVTGDTLDLEPILLEQMQLNFPMRTLCKDDCAGLCPVCGINRNDASCECQNETSDPRWAGLQALRGRLGDD